MVHTGHPHKWSPCGLRQTTNDREEDCQERSPKLKLVKDIQLHIVCSLCREITKKLHASFLGITSPTKTTLLNAGTIRGTCANNNSSVQSQPEQVGCNQLQLQTPCVSQRRIPVRRFSFLSPVASSGRDPLLLLLLFPTLVLWRLGIVKRKIYLYTCWSSSSCNCTCLLFRHRKGEPSSRNPDMRTSCKFSRRRMRSSTKNLGLSINW